MDELHGKVALITGALGTIGRAMAQRFSDAGADVLALDRPETKDAAKDLPPNVRFVGCDLNDLAQSQSIVTALAADVGGIDILVNNAALIINKPFADFSIEEYEAQLRVNSSAAFALVRACSPAMKEKGAGKVINLTSLTLNGRWDGYVPYVASKGAMLGLTKGLARELGPHGINVNAIAPGAIVSEAEERVFGDRLQEYNDWIIENQSLKRRIGPEHVADLALFLASAASDCISGQNIGIDGGW